MVVADTYLDELVPTDYSLRMRKYFIGLLGLIYLLAAGKLYIHDFWGATSILIIAVMGVFVVVGEYTFNASTGLFFSAMATVTAIFDMISLVLYVHLSKYHLLDPKAPVETLQVQVVFLVSPVVLLAAACLTYSMFVDCRDHASVLSPFASPSYAYTDELASLQVPSLQGRRNIASTRPFQGVGRKLGDL
eukprot:TRINITY_DN71339_c0_g1_i1.p1 TRINITY_DN71339_c0_g1~~TRINITY_DN71339_c0_g1_i1.p1  ORF type:complete len:190 (+),score=27.32 TRINITY_DN71339_c0_g1_i1:146-715(+)